MVSKLKIYSDRNLATDDYVTMLAPFWGEHQEEESDPYAGRFHNFLEVAPSFFELAPLEDADVAVYPVEYSRIENDQPRRDQMQRFVEKVNSAGKDTIVFYWNDSSEPFDMSGVRVMRTSIERSRRRAYEQLMPCWTEDLVDTYYHGQTPLREKSDVPTVGFCGRAQSSISVRNRLYQTARRLKSRLLGRRQPFPFMEFRGKVLRCAERSDRILTDFILRDDFWSRRVDAHGSRMAQHDARREFVENLADNDYSLCPRGGGNFSIRFYETLCLGRIPVVINSDIVLPFESQIDWSKHCVMVPQSQLSRIGKIIRDYHDCLSADGFRQRQVEQRRLWETWLSPVGFFRKLGCLLSNDSKPGDE